MIEIPRAALRADGDRRELRLLLLRHQRPDPDDVRLLARRRGDVPARVHRGGHPAGRSLRDLDQAAWASSSRSRRERGPARRSPKLKVGICGEHGGDPRSIEFFHHVGLDYVSCSPFRVPVARLAAAQAALAGAERGVSSTA